MGKPFNVMFPTGFTARVVRVQSKTELPDAFRELGIQPQRPTLVLIGGAGGLGEPELIRLRPLFTGSLAPLAETLGAAVIDGGTDSGVMQLMGQARAEGTYHFPLIGVAVETLVTWPDGPHRSQTISLESHHTHFVLVLGSNWGDESSWISQLATSLSGQYPSVTVLIDGGEIAWKDVSHSVNEDRPVVVVAGSGRTADSLSAAIHGTGSSEKAKRLVASGKLQTVDLADGPEALSNAVKQILSIGE